LPVRVMSDSDGAIRAIPQSFVIGTRTDANSVDTLLFVAPYPCEVVSVNEVHSVAGSDGSAVALDVMKCVGTEAPASGTTVLSSTFDLKSTANTPVRKTAASGLTATLANRKLDTGDRLSLNYTGTLTALVGVVNIELKRLLTAGGSF
jgi:hypothetical protein